MSAHRILTKGLTWFTPEEDQSLIACSDLLARIIATLGGRAAEQIIVGDPDRDDTNYLCCGWNQTKPSIRVVPHGVGVTSMHLVEASLRHRQL